MRLMGQLSECGGIRIACAADEFEGMVAFYVATFGAEVVHHEQWWASLGGPRHTHINIRAEDWYVPPVWPEQLPGHTETNALRVSRHRHGRRGGARRKSGVTVAPYEPYGRDPSRCWWFSTRQLIRSIFWLRN